MSAFKPGVTRSVSFTMEDWLQMPRPPWFGAPALGAEGRATLDICSNGFSKPAYRTITLDDPGDAGSRCTNG